MAHLGLRRLAVVSRAPLLSSRFISSAVDAPPDPVSSLRASGTLVHQDALPKQPIPPLEDSLQRYLSAVSPILDESEKVQTSAVIESFLAGEGPALHQKLLDYDADNTNYIEHFYRELFSSASCSSYSLNPNFVLFPIPGADTAASSAAFLVSASLQHYLASRDGMLEPMTRGKAKDPICMRQIPWIHASARIAREGKVDDLICDIDSSKHIVAFCRGVPFVVQVVNSEGQVTASAEALETAFEGILAKSAALPNPATRAVGSLTTGPRDIWAAARAKMEADPVNAASLSAIDKALLVVCLDGHVSGLSPEGMELNVLYGVEGTHENRWLDKWNIIVCGDGQAGMNWEHSMLDGHTMMEFFAPIGAGFNAGIPLALNADQPPQVEPLQWNLDSDTEAQIAAAIGKSRELSASVGVETLEFNEYGGSFIKSCKCSPDGFVQAAMMIAFYGLRQRLPVPYESVLAKAFKNGRVTVARNMSPLIAERLEAFHDLPDAAAKRESFAEIIGEIGRICRDAASAKDFDRPFLALKTIAAETGATVPILTDSAWSKMNDLDLCTSHCGRAPIRFFGYEPAAADGYSIGYFVENEHIQFSINHFDKTLAAQYKAALDDTLKSIREIFSS